MDSILFSQDQILVESDRLYNQLRNVGWSKTDCSIIAPLTLEINLLKKEKNAIILAHSYQTPDIIFGVSDYVGDSLGLSRKAASTNADIIIFAGVIFMAETAKILAPDKTVIIPSIKAGCSLADSITKNDVIELKIANPNVPIVSYVNTNADVKSVSDLCVTSANVIEKINEIDSHEVIFLPDKNMANYLRNETDKKIIGWNGVCIVHEKFKRESVVEIKRKDPDIFVIAHSECPFDVLEEVDLVGGTSDMHKYIIDHPEQKNFFLVTECGLSDRFAVEYPDREFYGKCSLCPYMKEIQLKNILQALENPNPDQIIEIDISTRKSAFRAINKMVN